MHDDFPPLPRPAFRGRAGVSLVEIVVAILLFSTGCLALLSSQTALTRLRTTALDRHALATLALTTLDSLRGISCTTLTGGTRATTAGRLTWTASPQRRVVLIRLSASPSSLRTGSPPWTADTLIPCVP